MMIFTKVMLSVGLPLCLCRLASSPHCLWGLALFSLSPCLCFLVPLVQVSQEPVLFSGSIADNIAYGKYGKASQQEVGR